MEYGDYVEVIKERLGGQFRGARVIMATSSRGKPVCYIYIDDTCKPLPRLDYYFFDGETSRKLHLLDMCGKKSRIFFPTGFQTLHNRRGEGGKVIIGMKLGDKPCNSKYYGIKWEKLDGFVQKEVQNISLLFAKMPSENTLIKCVEKIIL